MNNQAIEHKMENLWQGPDSKGFTLVELVIVIVILGILAVTAVPRFIDISSDARTASLQALASALNDAAKLVYSKSLIEGSSGLASASVVINNVTVETVYGYPQSQNINSIFVADSQAWLNISADRYQTVDTEFEWQLTDDTSDDGVTLGVSNNGTGIGFVLEGYKQQTGTAVNVSNCGVSYFQATSAGDSPEITIFNSEC